MDIYFAFTVVNSSVRLLSTSWPFILLSLLSTAVGILSTTKQVGHLFLLLSTASLESCQQVGQKSQRGSVTFILPSLVSTASLKSGQQVGQNHVNGLVCCCVELVCECQHVYL